MKIPFSILILFFIVHVDCLHSQIISGATIVGKWKRTDINWVPRKPELSIPQVSKAEIEYNGIIYFTKDGHISYQKQASGWDQRYTKVDSVLLVYPISNDNSEQPSKVVIKKLTKKELILLWIDEKYYKYETFFRQK